MKNFTLKFVLTFVLGLGLAFAAEAQTVRGVVKDAAGEPVIGAAVVVDGTTLGTSTGVDGSFSLNVPDAKNNVLVVSYIRNLPELQKRFRTEHFLKTRRSWKQWKIARKMTVHFMHLVYYRMVVCIATIHIYMVY